MQSLNIPAKSVAAPPISQLEIEIEALKTVALDLQEGVGQLDRRLVLVMRERPVPCPLETPEEVIVPLAHQLREIYKILRFTAGTIREIDDVLELPR